MIAAPARVPHISASRVGVKFACHVGMVTHPVPVCQVSLSCGAREIPGKPPVNPRQITVLPGLGILFGLARAVPGIAQ